MIITIFLMIMLKLMIMEEKMMIMCRAAETFESWLAPAGVMSRRLREAGGVHVAPWEYAGADI